VDGNVATLVNLSTIGAQVMSSTVLKPNQRVRMALNDDHGSVRFNASVAWASFEIPRETSPRYRAGLEFVDADGSAVDAFCARHKAK
jgi:PilZ domain-containing protein